MIQSATLFWEPKAIDVSELSRRNETGGRERFDRIFNRETRRLSESQDTERANKRVLQDLQEYEATLSSGQVDSDGSRLQDGGKKIDRQGGDGSGDPRRETGLETRPIVDQAPGGKIKVEDSPINEGSRTAMGTGKGAEKVLLQTMVEGAAAANKLQTEGMGDTKPGQRMIVFDAVEQGSLRGGSSVKPGAQQNGEMLELSGQQGDSEKEVVRAEHLRQAAKVAQGRSEGEGLTQTRGESSIKSNGSSEKGYVQIKIAESNPAAPAKTSMVEKFSAEGRDVETNANRQNSFFDHSREQRVKQIGTPHRQEVSEDEGENTINRSQQGGKSDMVRIEPGVVGSVKPVVMEKGAAAIEKLAEVQVERTQRQEIGSSVERVVKAAKATLARGASRIQIQLDPPELGRLLVDIRRNAAGVHLELHATTVKAQQLLEKNSGELRAALEAQGITTNQIEVHLKTDLRNETTLEQSQDTPQDQPESSDGDQSHDDGESGESGDDAFGFDVDEVENDETGLSMDEASEMGHERQVLQAGSVDVRG